MTFLFSFMHDGRSWRSENDCFVSLTRHYWHGRWLCVRKKQTLKDSSSFPSKSIFLNFLTKNSLNIFQYSLLQIVVEACQKKRRCKFLSSPKTFGGDPCPGHRKFIEVAYKCRPSKYFSSSCDCCCIAIIIVRMRRCSMRAENFKFSSLEQMMREMLLWVCVCFLAKLS